MRRDGLYRAMERLLLVYLIAILAVMVLRGNRVTPDLFFVFPASRRCSLDAARRLGADWFPPDCHLPGLAAWRGNAWQAGFTVQSDALIALSNAPLTLGLCRLSGCRRTARIWHLTAGRDPDRRSITRTLCCRWYWASRCGSGSDTFSIAHGHVAVCSIAQFVTTLLLPAAPPRFAYQYGQPLAVVDVGLLVKEHFGWGEASWLYQNISPTRLRPSRRCMPRTRSSPGSACARPGRAGRGWGSVYAAVGLVHHCLPRTPLPSRSLRWCPLMPFGSWWLVGRSMRRVERRRTDADQPPRSFGNRLAVRANIVGEVSWVTAIRLAVEFGTQPTALSVQRLRLNRRPRREHSSAARRSDASPARWPAETPSPATCLSGLEFRRFAQD